MFWWAHQQQGAVRNNKGTPEYKGICGHTKRRPTCRHFAADLFGSEARICYGSKWDAPVCNWNSKNVTSERERKHVRSGERMNDEQAGGPKRDTTSISQTFTSRTFYFSRKLLTRAPEMLKKSKRNIVFSSQRFLFSKIVLFFCVCFQREILSTLTVLKFSAFQQERSSWKREADKHLLNNIRWELDTKMTQVMLFAPPSPLSVPGRWYAHDCNTSENLADSGP